MLLASTGLPSSLRIVTGVPEAATARTKSAAGGPVDERVLAVSLADLRRILTMVEPPAARRRRRESWRAARPGSGRAGVRGQRGAGGARAAPESRAPVSGVGDRPPGRPWWAG